MTKKRHDRGPRSAQKSLRKALNPLLKPGPKTTTVRVERAPDEPATAIQARRPGIRATVARWLRRARAVARR